MKITTSSENIQAFGGLNFVSNEFNQLEFNQLIDNQLGSRGAFAQFSYSDILKNLWLLAFAGGDCAEDIQTHLKSELISTLGTKVCSADTLLRAQKELATSTKIVFSKNNIENQINTNDILNKLNIKILKKINAFDSSKYYDLDFDNQFIPTDKYDSKKSYKMKNGYFPSVATIGKNTVYFENRNGNSNVKFQQSETLEKIFNLLKDNDIKIARARMDCGSFTNEVINIVKENVKSFYIRAQKCENLTHLIKTQKDWKTIEINFKKVEVCSINYQPFNQQTIYRYVVSREANTNGQIDVFQGDNFIYRAIITNDLETNDKEIIEFYNNRGASEKIFDELNNDFLWKNLPFSFLNENTVFMMIMAMCRNFYLYLIDKLSQKIDFVENNFRLKKFIFRFIVVPYKWIKKGGQKTLKLYTQKPYNLIQ
jgi:sporulation protein YlmC with PRC-barrel domain